MNESLTPQQLFDKIQSVMEIHQKQLNEQYGLMTEAEVAYDEGYLNALDYVRRLMALTVVG